LKRQKGEKEKETKRSERLFKKIYPILKGWFLNGKRKTQKGRHGPRAGQKTKKLRKEPKIFSKVRFQQAKHGYRKVKPASENCTGLGKKGT